MNAENKLQFLILTAILAISFSLALLICGTVVAAGTTYYVNATSGDDTRTNAEAQNSTTPWKTISHGITNATDGDTIDVAAGTGTYTENLAIGKSLTLQGAGSGSVTLNGVHTITADNVTITGFTLNPNGGIGITIDSSISLISNIDIQNNVFNLTSGQPIGVLLGGYTTPENVSNVTMNYNAFYGPTSMISNPWKIGGWFDNPVNCEVEEVNFEHNTVNNGSIPINLQDQNITDVLINNNTFRNTDGVVYVWGEGTPTGVLSQFVFTNNDVDSTNSYGVGIDLNGSTVFDDSNFGPGNRVNNNNFVGILGDYGFKAVSILSPLASYTLDAENNWWGSVNGPTHASNTFNVGSQGDSVSDNVDYCPWLNASYPGGNSTRPVINVNTSEYFSSIQAAIDAANTTPGDTITARNGTFTENVDVNKSLTIRSENGYANCTVEANDSNDHVFHVTNCSVNISGFTVQNATGNRSSGIYLDNVEHCNISNNNVTNNYNGIRLNHSSINNLISNTVLNNSVDGISLYYSNTTTLTNNNVSYNSYYGIYLNHSSTNNLISNTVLNNQVDGISLYYSNYNDLTDNTLSYNNFTGICLETSDFNILLSNSVSNSSILDGVSLYSSNYNNLTDNTISNNSWYGIYLEASSNNNITNNTILNNSVDGISLYTSSNNILMSNTMSNNSYDGVYLEISNNNTLVSNTVLNTPILDGISLNSSSNNNITSNIISNNNLTGICLISSSNNNITSNTISNNSWDGIYLESSSNNNLIYNNYFNNPNNAWDDGTNNIWNITKTNGTNIINGPNLGGNYWSDYEGEDTDGDGLGNTETPYNSFGNITGGDYQPLTNVTETDIYQPINAISFGDVAVDSSLDKNTSISNNGTATLTINSITRTAGSSYFAYISPTIPFTIRANGSETITVRFAPKSAGSKSANFTVNSNDPDKGDVQFSVFGNGITPPAPPAPPAAPGGGGGGRASRDSDNDGYTDIYEIWKGTDPNDPCDPNPECAACLALRPPTPTTTLTPIATPTATPVPVGTPTAAPTPTPTPEEPGFGVVFAIAGLLAVAYLVLRRR